MTEPTDADIWQMWMPMVRRMGVADPVEFARAVLARWGQPAHSGEPVAWLDPWTSTKVTTDYDAYGKHGIPLVRQQPVEQELLCSTELESYSDAYAATPDEAVAFRDGWRLAEQHYGIKGGQHGTE